MEATVGLVRGEAAEGDRGQSMQGHGGHGKYLDFILSGMEDLGGV